MALFFFLFPMLWRQHPPFSKRTSAPPPFSFLVCWCCLFSLRRTMLKCICEWVCFLFFFLRNIRPRPLFLPRTLRHPLASDAEAVFFSPCTKRREPVAASLNRKADRLFRGHTVPGFLHRAEYLDLLSLPPAISADHRLSRCFSLSSAAPLLRHHSHTPFQDEERSPPPFFGP